MSALTFGFWAFLACLAVLAAGAAVSGAGLIWRAIGRRRQRRLRAELTKHQVAPEPANTVQDTIDAHQIAWVNSYVGKAGSFECRCGDIFFSRKDHAAHIAEQLAKAGHFNP